MALSPKGILYLGSLDGHVYALELQNGRVTARHVIASGLETPAGVAWRNGALYVSAVSKILRYDAIDTHLNDPPKPAIVIDTLPTETHHGWKFIAFGPDGKLYVPQGAPCNVCLKDRNRFGLIGRMDPDGSHYEVVARGIRNTVGFAWHPVTHELWFTDNGRDMMGDDVPDDKLNCAPRVGMDFGFPYCHGGDTPDPEFGKDHPCSAFTPPVVKLGAHVASLGMRFYSGSMFPAAYREQYFYRRTRFVESQQESRLPGRAGDHQPGRQQRASGSLCRRLAPAGRNGVGPPGRRPTDARWLTADQRRLRRRGLSRDLFSALALALTDAQPRTQAARRIRAAIRHPHCRSIGTLRDPRSQIMRTSVQVARRGTGGAHQSATPPMQSHAASTGATPRA